MQVHNASWESFTLVFSLKEHGFFDGRGKSIKFQVSHIFSSRISAN